MQGFSYNATKELIIKYFGNRIWQRVIDNTIFSEDKKIDDAEYIDDTKALELFKNICKELNIHLAEFWLLFGQYWVLEFTQKYYKSFYERNKDFLSFIYDLNNIHREMFDEMVIMRNPPEFNITRSGNKLELYCESIEDLLVYSSSLEVKDVTDMLYGMVVSLGKYYNEFIRVKKIGKNRLEIELLDHK
ncbi:MAG: heme NO-binding domain-containing protein [Deferribacterota bacterium]|nr:heme NO-binding domain-containing protein [Deferribacterota bacterium]